MEALCKHNPKSPPQRTLPQTNHLSQGLRPALKIYLSVCGIRGSRKRHLRDCGTSRNHLGTHEIADWGRKDEEYKVGIADCESGIFNCRMRTVQTADCALGGKDSSSLQNDEAGKSDFLKMRIYEHNVYGFQQRLFSAFP
jgi:hypothetical protein